MYTHCSGSKMLRNSDIHKNMMSNHLLTNMYHAHSLIMMKFSEIWLRTCKYTDIHNHAEGKQAADSNTLNHHLLPH